MALLIAAFVTALPQAKVAPATGPGGTSDMPQTFRVSDVTLKIRRDVVYCFGGSKSDLTFEGTGRGSLRETLHGMACTGGGECVVDNAFVVEPSRLIELVEMLYDADFVALSGAFPPDDTMLLVDGDGNVQALRASTSGGVSTHLSLRVGTWKHALAWTSEIGSSGGLPCGVERMVEEALASAREAHEIP